MSIGDTTSSKNLEEILTFVAHALEAPRDVVAPSVPAYPVPLRALVQVEAVPTGVGQVVALGAPALVRAGGVDASDRGG